MLIFIGSGWLFKTSLVQGLPLMVDVSWTGEAPRARGSASHVRQTSADLLAAHPSSLTANPSGIDDRPAQASTGISLSAGSVDLPSYLQLVVSSNPQPDYPVLARTRGEHGKVLLKVVLSQPLTPLNPVEVKELSIEKSSGSRVLDQSALTAVKAWHFPRIPHAQMGQVKRDSFSDFFTLAFFIPFRYELRPE